MKVLWVCNIMLPVFAEALGKEGSNKEGWLSGLCGILTERRRENQIELHIAYPVSAEEDGSTCKVPLADGALYGYGFYEDTAHAERYDEALEERLKRIIDRVEPDVIHCFGTEFGHTLAVLRCCPHPERVLVGMQGLCTVIAEKYMADLPVEVQKSRSFRDWLKKDSLQEQQEKYRLRGIREQEIVRRAYHITGRTVFDRAYTQVWNPQARYYAMNETLRKCFYEGRWDAEACEPHTIFLSQGDYPLKGLHYLLLAAGELLPDYPDLQIRVAGNSLVSYATLKDKIKISGYGKYLRKLIRAYGLEDRIHFLGKLTAEEMKREYLRCGLFVCCSANENSPNSLGEAMLLGVPCVAADVGGISSIFTGDVDGILYGEKDAESGLVEKEENNACYDKAKSLKESINRAWTNTEQMLSYSENARNHARKTHDSEENYGKVLEIYAKITSGNAEEKER